MTSADSHRSLPSPDQVVDALLAASDTLLALTAQAVAEADPSLTLPQHEVLSLLASRGGQRLPDLADDLDVTPAVAAQICQQLEHKQLIHHRAADGRLALTEGGSKLLTTVTAGLRRRLQDRAQAWDRCPGRTIEALDSVAAAGGHRTDQPAEPGRPASIAAGDESRRRHQL